MFRNYLSLTSPKKQINLEWVKKINGLIRVVICDPNSNKAFVIVYYEKRREYAVIAFNMQTGEFYWTKSVLNGGYGSPAIIDDIIIVPTQFTNIIALSKEDGREIWQVKTKWRMRSSINVINQRIYFSSGGTLYEVTSEGIITNKWEYPGAFFYGSVDFSQDLIFSLGTIEDKAGDSLANVFAFHKNGGIAYVLPICNAPVVSSDTSGIAWQGNVGFVGGNNIIKCFQKNDGQILWTSSVEGFAGRQICSVDNNRIYYTTQWGIVGALNILDGSNLWSISTNDKVIVSPISIFNDNLIVVADGHVNVLRSSNGQLVQKIPAGHAPYGMVSLYKEYGFLGAGEPPHNGLLLAFKFMDNIDEKYACYARVSNAFVESKYIDILVNVYNAECDIACMKLDGSIFNLNELILAEEINATTFSFRIPLPKTMNSGDFVIPLYLDIGIDNLIVRPILFKLNKKNSLPTRAYLNHISDIVQEKPTYSGAAIGSAIKHLHGDCNITQSDIREMIDFSLDRSGYEPFQTWRIILRRILTSKANKKEQLLEFNENYAE